MKIKIKLAIADPFDYRIREYEKIFSINNLHMSPYMTQNQFNINGFIFSVDERVMSLTNNNDNLSADILTLVFAVYEAEENLATKALSMTELHICEPYHE